MWRRSFPGCSPPPRRWRVLDVLCSFAVVSVKNDYTRPVINLSGKLYLKDSRHPCGGGACSTTRPLSPTTWTWT